MKLIVQHEIFRQFPDLRIGVLSARGIDNHGEEEEIGVMLGESADALVAAFQGIPITEHPHIAPWREAYRRFGAKPKKYPSSIENLTRRTLKGERIRHINKLVDIYNAISLRHLLPAGGEDLDRIRGNIVLTFAGENETPVQLLGEREKHAPRPGEVIYKDASGAICRRWNWKEADRTKISEESVNAVLVIEALPPVEEKELEAALFELGEFVKRYCGGDLRTLVLADTDREIAL